MRRELFIQKIGSQGDGVAETENGPVYVPYALPGERIEAEMEGRRGRICGLLEAAPDRVEPVCRHFGACGGCALQHFEWSAYLDWKRSRIAEALGMEGLEAAIESVRAFGPRSRRRAALALSRRGSATAFGFHRAGSHEIIGIQECPVLAPRLEAALPGLAGLLPTLVPQGEAAALVTLCENGLDIELRGVEGRLPPLLPAQARAAEKLGIVRLTRDEDPIFALASPVVRFAGIEVEPPPGVFLQASAEAESAMAEIAVEAVGKAARVADLFCGLGAFAFPLARKASVTAVEIDKRPLAAIERAARRAKGLKPVTALRRDLAREPLSALELKAYDAVVFDPPRAGALAQARMLAASRVPVVVAVSCNPVSFAKDARALVDGGYRLTRLVPIDQFVYSPHIELIAVFDRSGARK